MLASTDLQRSIHGMTISLGRRTAKKAAESYFYGLAEREQQFQYEISGTVGTLPVEAQVTITFALLFIAQTGNMRDSNLDRPQLRVGFEQEFGPPGIFYYAHLVQWVTDS